MIHFKCLLQISENEGIKKNISDKSYLKGNLCY